VLPLLILLVVVAFGGVVMHQAEMRDLLVNHNRQVVSGAADNLSGQLDQRQQVLTALANEAVSRSPQDVIDSATWIPVSFDGGVAIYSEDGNLLAATSSPTDWQALAEQVTRSAARPDRRERDPRPPRHSGEHAQHPGSRYRFTGNAHFTP
jgi:hypothetical protein